MENILSHLDLQKSGGICDPVMGTYIPYLSYFSVSARPSFSTLPHVGTVYLERISI